MRLDHDRIEMILVTALEIQSDIERQEYLGNECGTDTELRAQIDRLIANDRLAGSFLVVPEQPTCSDILPQEQPGTLIGTYKLLEQIGEGGFGVIYLAEQQRPIKRHVALKMIKPGMDSRQVVARFQSELQALALMEHPNISGVYDGGVTVSGRPYFVMELVQGSPITRYCDDHQLAPRQRLGLFIQICQAVQHAHQKGIIHRDLKPANILVADRDGTPTPKVIDFGVAKALGQPLNDITLATGLGRIVGTLAYMSPEQAELKSLDVDTRSDIYSLGVLLYELLTGSTPLTQETIKTSAVTELLRIIREVDPPSPSSRLTDSRDLLTTISADRKLLPTRLTKEVRGELDWIVMKCLDKDRSRRYETANALALDIQRFLADEPVLARPPTVNYRLSKFVRRHRVALMFLSVVLLSLVGGLIGLSVALAQVTHQKHLALMAGQRETQAVLRERERANAEANERQRAETAEAESEAIIDFLLNDLIAQAGSPAQIASGFKPNPNLTVREAIERAADQIELHFQGNPEVKIAIRQTIGKSYLQLGLFESAAGQFEKALNAQEQQLGRDHSDTLENRDLLAEAYRGAANPTQAIELLKHNAELRAKTLGPEHIQTLITRDNLGVSLRDAGRSAEALEIFEQVREAKLRIVGPNDSHTLVTLHNLASMHMDAGNMTLAIPLLESIYLAKSELLGAEDTNALPSLHNLAVALWKTKQLDRSIPKFELLLRVYERIYGEQHPLVMSTQANLGVNYRDDGRFEEAIVLLDDVWQRNKSQPTFRWVARELSMAFELAAKFDKAAALERELLNESRRVLEPDSLKLAAALTQTGGALLRFQAWADAAVLLRESLELREKLAPDDWQTFQTKSMLGEALYGLHDFVAAEPLLLEGQAGIAQKIENKSSSQQNSLKKATERLIRLYEAQGEKEKAEYWRQIGAG